MKLLNTVTVFSSLGLGLWGCAAPVHNSAAEAAAASSQTAPTPVLPPLKGGGYYKDDGPGANPPANIAAIPDAVPRREPLHRYANDPYRILGVTYTPDLSGKPYIQEGMASWYGRRFHDKDTSSGEKYDMYAMTAAHRTLPIPSYARVTNLDNGRSIVVRVNDRGPFHNDRLIDLSYTAAYKLDILRGVTRVRVESVASEGGPESSPLAEPVRLYKAHEETELQGTPLAADPTQAPTATPIPAATSIWLQLGAFAKPESADTLVQQVNRTLGGEAPPVSRIDAGGLHRVQVGPFADSAAADRASKRLYTELKIAPYRTTGNSPAAVARPAAPAAATSAPGIYLQVAAVAKVETADAFTAKLGAHSLPGLHRLEKNGLIKIQVGPYASQKEADAAAASLEALLGQRPFAVTR